MTSTTITQEAEKLYQLMPMEFRIQDAKQGGTLKAFLTVMAEQLALMQENMDQLYDEQFIETCAEWVVPYIGDLIGYRSGHEISDATYSRRAEVANTIAYRRRKGTASVLEQLARDVTGWNARAVEFFQQLKTSQFINHIRSQSHATVDMRQWQNLERLDTAFNQNTHLIDVRNIASQKGKYNIPNIGIFLWRLNAYSLKQTPAFRLDNQRFLFSSLGNNTSLTNRPQAETSITHIAEPINVPEQISMRVMSEFRQDYYDEQVDEDAERLSVTVYVDGNAVALSDIHICTLEDFAGSWANIPTNGVTIDPVLGRIAFADAQPANADIRVTYHYAFSAAMGGGEYERADAFQITTVADESLSHADDLQTALNNVASGGLVEVIDNGRFSVTPTVNVNANAVVELRAANEHRAMIDLSGSMQINLAEGAEFILDGFLIAGGDVTVNAVAGTDNRTLKIRHCTLVPGLALTINGEPVSADQPSLILQQENLTVVIEKSIVGGIRADREVTVKISDSIIDATDKTHVAFADVDAESAGGSLTCSNVTVVGKVHARKMPLVSNSIFCSALADVDAWSVAVRAEQRQDGCIRFCYLPPGSIVPRRFRCQPELAVADELLKQEQLNGNATLTDAEKQAITEVVQARVQPGFTTMQYGQAAYMQLLLNVKQIRQGAEDESEMGAFHDLFAPQRETNLNIRLKEYLRFGLQAGIFYAS